MITSMTKVNDAIKLGENMSNTLDDFQKLLFSPIKNKKEFILKECVEHALELFKIHAH